MNDGFFTLVMMNVARAKKQKFEMLAKGWVLATSSAEKNIPNASIGGVGLLLSPKAYQALTKVEKISARILQATFDGNPKTKLISCYSQTSTCVDQTRNDFYILLLEKILSIPKHNIQIVGGEMNAKIGPSDCNGFTFNRRTNENGLALLSLIDKCGILLLNTKFQKSTGKLWTFVYPNGEKAQLDCILINKKWQNSATNAEAYNSFSSVGSDHRIITAKLKLELRASKPRKHQPKYDWQALTKNTEVVQKYQLEIQN